MDVQSLATVLEFSFDPDAGKRKLSEERLEALGKTQGFVSILLQVVMSSEISFPVKQSASLLLKNTVSDNWQKEDYFTNPSLICEADRQSLRSMILHAVVAQTDQRLRVQLLEVFYHMARRDLPDHWPNLLNDIMQLVQSDLSQASQQVYGGLCALRMVFKRFQYHNNDLSRELTRGALPVLLGILEKVMPSFQDNQACQEMARVIVKIYYLATHDELPAELQNPETLGRWMNVFIFVLTCRASAEQSAQDEFGECLVSKTQKSAGAILVRFLDRFSNPSSEEYKSFRTTFIGPMAISALDTFIRIVQAHTEHVFVPEQVLRVSFEYLRHCVDFAALYHKLRPQLPFLLTGIFRVLLLSAEDLELFEEDPAEFVYRSGSAFEDYFDPRTAASDLLVQIVRVRTRDSLESVLSSIQGLLQGQQQQIPEKDAALRMLGALAELLVDEPSVSGFVESLLTSAVVPDFDSSSGILRSRACWVAGCFAGAHFTTPQLARALVEGVVRNLSSEHFAVRIEAAGALSSLLRREDAVEFARPFLQHLLTALFQLVGKPGSEITLDALDALVSAFAGEIAPYAQELCAHLCAVYRSFAEHGDEQDEEAFCAALQAVRTITSVLWAVQEVPDLYPQLEPVLLPLVESGLVESGFTILEDVLEILGFLSAHSISPSLWTAYSLVLSALDAFALDYLSSALSFLEHCCQDPQGLLHSDRLHSLLAVCAKAINSQDVFMGVRNACRVFQAVLLHCPAAVDHVYGEILGTVTRKLSEVHQARQEDEVSLPTKLALVETLSVCVYYNPRMFLQALVQWNCVSECLQVWLSYAPVAGQPQHQQPYGLRCMSLALSALGTLSHTEIPDNVRSTLHNVVLAKNIAVLSALRSSGKSEISEEVQQQQEEEEDNQSKFLDIPDDQDFCDQGEFGLIHELEYFLNEDLGYDDEDYDEEDEEEESPLEKTDPFIYFAESVQFISSRDAPAYQQTVATLSQTDQQTLQQHLQWAAHMQNLKSAQ